jgi:hypothetical protein
MAVTQEKTMIPDATTRIDPTAPAGSENSLGEESIRDGRPTTDDSIVEAIDEETPVTPASPSR